MLKLLLKFLNFLGKIPILKEFEWFEWFEWFGPSAIEPFNSGEDVDDVAALLPVPGRVERFDRRGTEPFEPFEPFEFFQNSNFPGFFPRKFKNSRKFQHFLNYRRNSDKISSKSEQKSVKRIQK